MIKWCDEWTRGYKENILLGSSARLPNNFYLKIELEWKLHERRFVPFLMKDGYIVCREYRSFKKIETAKKVAASLISRRIRDIKERSEHELRSLQEALSTTRRREQRK